MPREDDTHVKVTGVRLPAPLLTGPQARNDWIRWKEDWQDYAIVQDLHSKPDAVQCSLFRMALGTDGKKLLRSQPMPKKPDGTPMDPNKLATLLETMKIAIVGEVNVTYELYVFQTRVQQKGEPFDEFLLALRELMKTCDFCEHMTDHMLKSQVIRGVREDATRERLLQERQLTLAKCVDMCRAAESASTQARDMASGTNADVNWVSRYGKPMSSSLDGSPMTAYRNRARTGLKRRNAVSVVDGMRCRRGCAQRLGRLVANVVS